MERAEKFRAALSTAVSGPDADQALASLLSDPALDVWERVQTAAALGDARGVAGSAALRQAFSAALENYPAASKRNRPAERPCLRLRHSPRPP
jgi:hypothetical protein